MTIIRATIQMAIHSVKSHVKAVLHYMRQQLLIWLGVPPQPPVFRGIRQGYFL
jgi:hypothetical protein